MDDLTNTYFEGRGGGATAGESRPFQGEYARAVCPLLTLASLVRSMAAASCAAARSMAGKISGRSRCCAVCWSGLEVPKGALIVMDCGAATEQNLSWRARAGVTAMAGGQRWKAHATSFDAAAAVSLTTAGEAAGTGAEGAQRRRTPRCGCIATRRRVKGKEQAMLKKACARFEKDRCRNPARRAVATADALTPRSCRGAVWRRIGERLLKRSTAAGPDSITRSRSPRTPTARSGHRRHLVI